MPEKPTSLGLAQPVSLDLIKRRIHVVRGQKVMIDDDLAKLYLHEHRNHAHLRQAPRTRGQTQGPGSENRGSSRQAEKSTASSRRWSRKLQSSSARRQRGPSGPSVSLHF